jgi:predicted nucleic acid-binding protein
MTDLDRQLEVMEMLSEFRESVRTEDVDRKRAVELRALGFKAIDSLHLACAERAGVDIFLTTDDALENRARRHAGLLRVRVANPLSWVKEVLEK